MPRMVAPADPTLAFLDQFKDASRWVVVPNVPIFRGHQRKDKQGRLITVGDRELQAIAYNQARVLADPTLVAT